MAWERRNPMLGIGILIGGDMVYKDMMAVAFGLEKPQNTIIYFETKKPNVDLSRNMVTAQMLRDKCEWCFFLDADVIPPLHTISELLSHNTPIISALYWRRYEGMEPCIYHNDKKGIPITFNEAELAPLGLNIIEVDACGAGCLLIHSSVFEKLKPYVEEFKLLDPMSREGEKMQCWKFWEYIVHSNVNLSEDIVLASRVKSLGYRIFADLRLRCGHLSNVMIKEGSLKQTPLATGYSV